MMCAPAMLSAQIVSETFNATRIINGHSVETLKKRYFEYRIEHRFGDMGGDAGGAQAGFGFDNAADIRFAFEYGLSDKLMIGLGRTKGNIRAYRNNLDAFVKYRLLRQEKEKMPVSMTLVASALYCYNKAVEDELSVLHFPEFAHRLAYATQLNIARKMSDRISLSLMPTYVHRNYVSSNDVNGLFALGGALNIKLSKSWGILAEYYHNLNGTDVRDGMTNSFAIGAEWCTNGHNFHFNITNASLFNEVQFISYTSEDWSKGQFRLGFSITRNFKR